jgi:hypothetical protein
MNAQCQINQSGYVPQSGLLQTSNAPAVAAADWASVPPDPPASLADCRDRIPASSPFNPTCVLWEKEEQVSVSPYTLLLDASSESPTFVYDDAHISIELLLAFLPFGNGISVDNSDCGLLWDLRVLKKRRQSAVRLNDFLTMQPVETTYGPQTQGGISAAAVARSWPFEYGTADSLPQQLNYPFQFPNRLFGTHYNEVSYTSPSSTMGRPGLYSNAYNEGGTVTANYDPSGSGLTLELHDRTGTNNAFAIFDRTSSDYSLQPKLFRNPSYLFQRTSDSQILFSHDQTTVSAKTIGFSGSQFTVSAIVRLIP